MNLQIPDRLITELSLYFPGYLGYDFTDILIPEDAIEVIEKAVLSAALVREIMNGCGSKGTGEIVPDTLWGLRVTAICNIHDVTHHLAKTPDDCKESNLLLLRNLTTFINNNSANFVMRWARRYRAMSYYSAVEEYKKQFCRGYKSGKEDV